MVAWSRLGLLAVLMLAPWAARAESLRCSGGIAGEGDSRLSVVYKCGQPMLKDSYCAPLYYSQSQNLYLVPEPYANAYLPCQQTEEWIYDRGPGNLVATVRIRSGVVQSIVYGRQPR